MPVAFTVIIPLFKPHAVSLVTLGGVIVGRGLTVIEYVEGAPAQPFKVGVTVIMPETGVEPAFTAVKLGTFPVPLVAGSPIGSPELVQVYVAPAGVLEKLVAETTAPSHTAKLVGTVTTAVGLTVIV